MILGSQECLTKTGEISALRELIRALDIEGAVVVADALHCHQKTAQAIVEEKAEYLLAVKDNQPTLKDDIALYIHEESLAHYRTKEKNGGRIETRTAYVSHDIEWLDGHQNWSNLSCIGAIHTQFEKNGQKSSQWHYYISSASLTPQDLLKHARLEWGVESMHWLLDVHFAEDKTRVFDMNVQKTLNCTRKIALNLIKSYKEKTNSKIPLSKIMKQNLFDLNCFTRFLDFISSN